MTSNQTDEPNALRRPPYDPSVASALEATERRLSPRRLSVRPEHIQTIRSEPEIVPNAMDELDFDSRDYVVPGFGGDEIGATIYRPMGVGKNAPVIYYLHGGGMISGTRHSGVDLPIRWATDNNAVVVSLEYRLAPEFPDPVPVEDCYAGLLWLAKCAEALEVDGSRVVIAGGSAGGGLAAGTTLLARDRRGPGLIGQLLMCPMLDDRNDSQSVRQYEDIGSWDRISNYTGWNALLGSRRGTDSVSSYAAPSRAIDLSGLPPTFIDVGSAEPFRDEDVAFASKIWSHGGAAELHVWPGGTHGFELFAPDAAISRGALRARREWLARMLAPA